MSEEKDENVEAQDIPVNIIAQYVRDLSFENPNASEVLRGGRDLPEMDLNIGMDARKIEDKNDDALYEVVLNIRAEAKQGNEAMFIGELQYGATVSIGDEIPEESHHPFLLIEIPRLIFPFARQIMSDVTISGGYPPLMLNPIDFHALYMQRFGEEIEAARQELREELQETAKKDTSGKKKK
ncbi:MAG: protein-export chaperone SecB [Alphaproteobacteria bacterium]|nr:protein-export chaperone SecB [Alphaproteobacteria bacterium]